MNIDIMFPIQIIPTQFLIALKNKYEQMAKKNIFLLQNIKRIYTFIYITNISASSSYAPLLQKESSSDHIGHFFGA